MTDSLNLAHPYTVNLIDFCINYCKCSVVNLKCSLIYLFSVITRKQLEKELCKTHAHTHDSLTLALHSLSNDMLKLAIAGIAFKIHKLLSNSPVLRYLFFRSCQFLMFYFSLAVCGY